MKTKCIVLGEKEPQKESNSIKFCRYLNSNLDVCEGRAHPGCWKNAELISKEYDNRHDLIFVYDDDRSHGVLFIGFWNDGFC